MLYILTTINLARAFMNAKPTQPSTQKKLSTEFVAALKEALGKLPDDSPLKRFFGELTAIEGGQKDDAEAVAHTGAHFYERRLDSLAHATANMPTNPTHPSADDLTRFLAGFSENERIAMQQLLGMNHSRRDTLRLLGGVAAAYVGHLLVSDGFRRKDTRDAERKRMDGEDKANRRVQGTKPSFRHVETYEVTAGFTALVLASTMSLGSLGRLLREDAPKYDEVTTLAAKLVGESDTALREAIHLEAAKASTAGRESAAGR